MDLKNFFRLSNRASSLKKAGKNLLNFWTGHQQFFFILFALVSVFFGLYFWYNINYHSGWSKDQKKAYILSQEREVDLKEAEFKKVIEKIEKNKTDFNADHQPAKDIFKSY